MTLVIGFGHKARHGKDTAGEAIKAHFDKQRFTALRHVGMTAAPVAKIYKWTMALYAETNAFLESPWGKQWARGVGGLYVEPEFEIPDWVTPDPTALPTKEAPWGKHSRLLQWWGTDYRRNNFGHDYWVIKTMADINREKVDIAIITDTRFPNEAAAIKAVGGWTQNVTRLNPDGTVYASPDRDPNHISETGMDDYQWDGKWIIPHGHAALTAELAITLAEYLRGLKR